MCKFLVICQDDADGIICAAAIIKKFKLKMFDTKVVISKPSLLHEVKVSVNIRGIFIANMHINSDNFQGAAGFIDRNSKFIICWIDNYRSTREFLGDMLHFKLSCDNEAPSSAATLKNSGYNIPNEWVATANACNNPLDYPSTALSDRYTKAFEAAVIESGTPKSKQVQKVHEAFLEELINKEESITLTELAATHGQLLSATTKAVGKFTELMPKVGVILLDDERVDKSRICQEGHKLFPTLAIQFHSHEDGQPMTLLSTKDKRLNLVSIFGLSCRPSYIIHLEGRLLAIREQIKEKLS